MNNYFGNAYAGYGNNVPYGYPVQQSRMMQTEQFGYNPNMVQNQQVQQMKIKGRPVASYEEANASMIDLDGSMYVFPDPSHNRIYTKQILLDGTAETKIYTLDKNPVKQEAANNENYVLRSDFENVVNELVNQIKALKGGIVNDATSNATNDPK